MWLNYRSVSVSLSSWKRLFSLISWSLENLFVTGQVVFMLASTSSLNTLLARSLVPFHCPLSRFVLFFKGSDSESTIFSYHLFKTTNPLDYEL